MNCRAKSVIFRLRGRYFLSVRAFPLRAGFLSSVRRFFLSDKYAGQSGVLAEWATATRIVRPERKPKTPPVP